MGLKTSILLILMGALLACSQQPEVRISQGRLLGLQERVGRCWVEAFLSVPYAQPPLGPLRFAKPEPAGEFSDVLNATQLPPGCPQTTLHIFDRLGTPSDRSVKIVSTSTSGDPVELGNCPSWCGSTVLLATEGNVVVVTVNYRVGSFGFLTAGIEDAPGNMGLYDQTLALEWVRDNVAAFGGNPNMVTIFGQSAGASSVAYHMISPLSEGLFHRGILESGSSFIPIVHQDVQSGINLTDILAQRLGCAQPDQTIATDPATILECLRSTEPERFAELEYTMMKDEYLSFIPVVGEEFIPIDNFVNQRANHTKDIDIMIGFSEKEGTYLLFYLFPNVNIEDPERMLTRNETIDLATRVMEMKGRMTLPDNLMDIYFAGVGDEDKIRVREVFAEIIGDWFFLCPGLIFADRQHALNPDILFYMFTYQSSVPTALPSWLGPTHFEEVPFVYGLPLEPDSPYKTTEKAFSIRLMKLWGDYAAGRNPHWHRYRPESGAVTNLHPSKFGQVDVPRAQRCYDLWRPYFLAMYRD
ncbi:BCHE [Cordylochernes scorpioides]|uniref:Carboxylic ester hydrolase n=1 Tax=Cordylochernes scorpioides TaxID=51811 RepID=A0ABY6KMM2_9ARAC|nr:BCHE [Cordylochernes scorpioides]